MHTVLYLEPNVSFFPKEKRGIVVFLGGEGGGLCEVQVQATSKYEGDRDISKQRYFWLHTNFEQSC